MIDFARKRIFLEVSGIESNCSIEEVLPSVSTQRMKDVLIATSRNRTSKNLHVWFARVSSG